MERALQEETDKRRLIRWRVDILCGIMSLAWLVGFQLWASWLAF